MKFDPITGEFINTRVSEFYPDASKEKLEWLSKMRAEIKRARENSMRTSPWMQLSFEAKELANAQSILLAISAGGGHVGMISDGYNSFDELYAQRVALFKVICKLVLADINTAPVFDASKQLSKGWSIWKSKNNADGSPCPEGWFIAGLVFVDQSKISIPVPIAEFDEWPGTNMPKAFIHDTLSSEQFCKKLNELL
jgi:hypothetical protein